MHTIYTFNIVNGVTDTSFIFKHFSDYLTLIWSRTINREGRVILFWHALALCNSITCYHSSNVIIINCRRRAALVFKRTTEGRFETVWVVLLRSLRGNLIHTWLLLLLMCPTCNQIRQWCHNVYHYNNNTYNVSTQYASSDTRYPCR